MTGGTISALVLADRIAGVSTDWTAAYDPSRVPPVSLGTAQNAATVARDTVQVGKGGQSSNTIE